jgi:hypothetical protein
MMRLVWWCGTLHFVIFAFHWFRSPDFSTGLAVCRQIAEGTLHTPNLPASVLAVIVGGYLLHLTPRRWEQALSTHVNHHTGPAVKAAMLVLLALVLQQLSHVGGRPFIYFQF